MHKVIQIEKNPLQEEVLSICQSVDDELTCLMRYAENCQQKLTENTFEMLEFLISSNNDTIISCRAKEKDWIGFEADKTESKWEIFWF